MLIVIARICFLVMDPETGGEVTLALADLVGQEKK